MMRWSKRALAALCLAAAAQAALAEERRIVVAASADLAASGLLKHLLPRFALKTGTRVAAVDLAEAADADVLLGPRAALGTGRPVFESGGAVYLCRLAEGGGARAERAARFLDWLTSDIGRRTVESFVPSGARAGAALYTAVSPAAAPEGGPARPADAARGARAALAHCGRCHVVGPVNRMGGLDSTPSFAVLRTLGDWELRLRGFYLLNPHPSFTQIAGVTEPFDIARPPPIAPLRITLEEVEAIAAYVAAMRPADLGAPIRPQ